MRSYCLRVLSVAVLIVDYLYPAMASNGDVAALIADVKSYHGHILIYTSVWPKGDFTASGYSCWGAPSRRFPAAQLLESSSSAVTHRVEARGSGSATPPNRCARVHVCVGSEL